MFQRNKLVFSLIKCVDEKSYLKKYRLHLYQGKNWIGIRPLSKESNPCNINTILTHWNKYCTAQNKLPNVYKISRTG